MARPNHPTRRRPHRAAAALLVAVALTLIGCGRPERTPEAVLDAAMLQLADFPPNEGWRLDPTPDTPEGAQFDQQLLDCLASSGVLSPDRVAAQRSSDGFVQASSLAGNWAWVVPDTAARTGVLDKADPFVGCITTALDQGTDNVVRSAPEGIEVATPAERTEARAVQIGAADRSVFIDMVLVEQRPTVILTVFVHRGSLSLIEESGIVGGPVKRVAER